MRCRTKCVLCAAKVASILHVERLVLVVERKIIANGALLDRDIAREVCVQPRETAVALWCAIGFRLAQCSSRLR